MNGGVRSATVDATGRRGRTAARSSLNVVTSRTGGIGASVCGTGVVDGANGADGVSQGAPRGNVTVA